jgi:hypothetical protein
VSRVTGEYNTINNNILHDAGYQATSNSAIITVNSSNNTVTGNTLWNAGKHGICHGEEITGGVTAQNNTIEHNEIARFCTRAEDGAGTVVAYNRISDDRSSTVAGGVQVDDDSSGIAVHHNLVTNVKHGIKFNNIQTNVDFYNNTIFGCDSQMRWSTRWSLTCSWRASEVSDLGSLTAC